MKAHPLGPMAVVVLLLLGFPRPARVEDTTFQVGEVTVAPGQTDAVLPVSLLLESSADPVVGWQFAVRYDPAIFEKMRAEPARAVDFFVCRKEDSFVLPGTMGAAGVTCMQRCTSVDLITASSQGPIVNLKLCVRPDAPAGTYPIEFDLEGLSMPRFGVDFPPIYTELDSEGTPRSMSPAFVNGAVTVSGSAASGECPPDPPDYEPPDPPADLQGTFRLDGGTAMPGGTVTLPFISRANYELAGFSFSIDFDEEVLEAVEAKPVYKLGDHEWYLADLLFDNTNAAPGNGGVDEGYVAGFGVFSSDFTPLLPPPDKDNVILEITFRVKDTAPFGPTNLSLVNGAQPPGYAQPLENIMTLAATSVSPTFSVSPVMVGSILRIVPDLTIFVRGDSNDDGKVDISDATFTLSFLFLGGRPPRCPDGADANDSGLVDISDPIATLEWLFLGGPSLPAPYQEQPAHDTTWDMLPDCALAPS